MNVLVIYESQFGNTEQIAQAVAVALRTVGPVTLRPAAQVQPADWQGVDLIAVGGPTQRHGLPPLLHALLDHLPPDALGPIPALAFDTRYHAARLLTGSAATGIAQRLTRAGCLLLVPAESFFVTDQDGPLVEGEVARAGAWAEHALGRLAPARRLAPAT